MNVLKLALLSAYLRKGGKEKLVEDRDNIHTHTHTNSERDRDPPTNCHSPTIQLTNHFVWMSIVLIGREKI